MSQRLALAIAEHTGVAASAQGPDRIAYARDLWPRHHLAVRAGRIAEHRPAVVAWPECREQLCELVSFCSERGVPIVPFGGGSGVCGGVLPTREMVVVDVKRLKGWRLDRECDVVVADAGVLGIRLEEELAPLGFTVGHFPSSILCSTVGGWVAARGAGQCSGRYGKIEDMVAALDCVDGRGELCTLRRRVCGPDLTPLWIGSEGVLGVIAGAELRLHPHPDRRGFIGLSFPTMQLGCEALRRIYQSGLRPAVSRLYDPFDSMMARRGATRQARKARRTRRGGGLGRGFVGKAKSLAKRLVPGLGALALRNALRMPGAIHAIVDGLGGELFGGAMLVLIFEGSSAAGSGAEVHQGVERARRIGLEFGAEDLGEAPARHWLEHRYSVSYRQAPMMMLGAFVDTMEVAAPWSKLDGLYHAVRGALGRHAMVMAHLSHAYPDGCSIYFTFAGSGANEAACEREYDRAWQDALDAAIAAGGTLSHHHGVGRSKAPKLAAEIGIGVELCAAVRKAIDPAGIFNPGNLEPRGATTPARPLASVPPVPVLDERDQLVHASGAATLRAIEAVLEARGLSLAVDLPAAVPAGSVDLSLGDWLASGAPGAPIPWHDPVDHLVAGFSAELHSGASLTIDACPRRAAGPDWYALFHGMAGAAGRIHSAYLRARDSQNRAPELPARIASQPPVDPTERAWIDRVLDAARRV